MTDQRIATPSMTVGPFFKFGLTTNHALGQVAAPDAPGQHIRLRFRVVDGDGLPVPDAVVEIWHADAGGRYPEEGAHPFRGFGRLETDTDGGCTFETIRPGAVTSGTGERDAAHINICLFMRGLLRHVYTRAYFDGDPDLAADPVLGAVPPGRRASLLARATGQAGEWTFEVRLQGPHETVFFDL